MFVEGECRARVRGAGRQSTVTMMDDGEAFAVGVDGSAPAGNVGLYPSANSVNNNFWGAILSMMDDAMEGKKGSSGSLINDRGALGGAAALLVNRGGNFAAKEALGLSVLV